MSFRSGLSHRENRAALLSTGNGPSSSSGIRLGGGRESPLPLYNTPRMHQQQQQGLAHRTAEELERQNDESLEGLSAKVKLLKDITTNIGASIKDSTKMLEDMNDDFSNTGGLLSGTMKRMNKMAKRQGGQWCYWMGFLLLVFFFFFWTWVWRR